MVIRLILLVLLSKLVAPACECGFLVRNPISPQEQLRFLDFLESDFTNHEISSDNQDWISQGFNVTADAGHGTYGKAFTPDNVDPHLGWPVNGGQQADDTHHRAKSNDGLELWVDSDVVEGNVISAEVDTARQDLVWGSYRAGIKVTTVTGTCSAFFWYRNNTQEIDIEFLSREFNWEEKVFPINLVIQSQESMDAGYDAKATGTFKQINLTFDPTESFHEYRFDYLPGRVNFYADSELLTEMTGDSIPSTAGHLILQHWSNGNALWSGGPPERDASLTISYVKAYFNSSDTSRNLDLAKQCNMASGDGSVCIVPEVTAKNASTGGDFLKDKSSGADRSSDNENSSNGLRIGDGRLLNVLYMVGIIWRMTAR